MDKFKTRIADRVYGNNRVDAHNHRIISAESKARWRKPQDKIAYEKIQLIKSGDLGPISYGGIYNPGLIRLKDRYAGILRVEANYDAFTGAFYNNPCRPYYYEFNGDLKEIAHRELEIGDIERTRLEDFRVFQYEDRLLVGHVAYILDAPIETNQWLSEIKDNKLQTLFKFTSPQNRPEKNWGWFIHNHEPHFVYSVNPLIIYKLFMDTGYIGEVCNIPWDCKWQTDGSMISVSTNPVKYEDAYLMWVHIRVDRGKPYGIVYEQTAIMLSEKTLEPLYFIPQSLFYGGEMQGHFPRVMYLSSMVAEKHELMLFLGEADSHTTCYKVGREVFNRLLYSNKL